MTGPAEAVHQRGIVLNTIDHIDGGIAVEPQVAAVLQAHVDPHIAGIGSRVVGDNNAMEAPLAAQDVFQQLLVCAAPDAADGVNQEESIAIANVIEKFLEGRRG